MVILEFKIWIGIEGYDFYIICKEINGYNNKCFVFVFRRRCYVNYMEFFFKFYVWSFYKNNRNVNCESFIKNCRYEFLIFF